MLHIYSVKSKIQAKNSVSNCRGNVCLNVLESALYSNVPDMHFLNKLNLTLAIKTYTFTLKKRQNEKLADRQNHQ